MTEVVTAPPEVPSYKDRTGGLVAVGIMELLFGSVCAGFVLLMAVLTELAPRSGAGAAPPTAAFAMNVVIYSLFAAYFFSVGIGSIRRRRWARALGLIVSWMWLLVGVVSLATLAVLLPRLLPNFAPGGPPAVIMAVIFGTTFVLYVFIPGIFILFYRSRHVQATCEAHDRKVRWTDRAPLPVIGVSLMFACGAVALLASLSYAAVPLLGTILTGVPAMIVVLAVAGLMALLALQLYRLKLQAWWTLLLFQIAGVIVGTITLLRTNFDELYERMGIMTPQLRALHLGQLYRDPLLWLPIGATWLGFFLFVLWIRRYFVRPGPRTRAGDVTDITTALT